MDVELILSALNEVISDVGVHDSLKNHLPDRETHDRCHLHRYCVLPQNVIHLIGYKSCL